ncbi:gliding motility protein GldN [Marinilongibacter aquaticus]|uniref:type IX secretion system ring protein PorN/GldN n=1 Tax=Marinilongibacter aquaticus TaxID=2975157 RepID=UPI0021BDB978|nr:gliding motility protein GldN [Marinilongibacter aquaticus]UBM58402.1 gliding motility protein GldN [Marinilongibacter aquaticus]
MKKFKALAVLAGLGISQFALAQEKTDNGLNPLSLRPIHESNVAYKVRLWRRVDLREKQNQPLFSKENEITKVIIDGVKAGILDAYTDDKVDTRLTLEEFNGRMFKKFEGAGLSQEEIDAGFGATTEDDGWGTGATSTTGGADDGWGDGSSTASTESEDSGSIFDRGNSTAQNAENSSAANSANNGYEMFPNEFYVLELKEDWVFDKQRSRQYFDIQTVTIKIPAEKSNDGLEKTLASFKYVDLEQFFRNNPDAIWFNEKNIQENMNLADAFELRLFHGLIVKKSNALDKYLDEQYGSPREALIHSQEIEYDLLEFEHDLWEY